MWCLLVTPWAGMFLQQPVHPTKTSSQVDCFTQQTEESRGKAGFLFPVSFIRDSMACSYKTHHICILYFALKGCCRCFTRIILCLKWILLATYCLCLLSSSAKLFWVKVPSWVWRDGSTGGALQECVCMNAEWKGARSLPGALSGCSSQHFPVLYPGAIRPWGLSQLWGGGSGQLLGQVGVETPVLQEKMSDNAPGTTLPEASDISRFWKRIKGL